MQSGTPRRARTGKSARRAEHDVRMRQALEGAIVDSALDSVVTIDAQGRVVEFNRAAERTFGRAREDVLGQEMCELIIPPELREAHRRALLRSVATGEGRLLNQRLEMTGMRADGSRFPVELTITRLDQGDAPLFTGWLRDITERKRAEEERERLLQREESARVAAQRLAERFALLAEAGALVGASLDYEETLAAVAHATVPQLADWCAVDILEEDGSIKPAAVAHADPAREKWAWELRSRYPVRPDASTGTAKVIRTGTSELMPEITDSAIVAAARDDEHLALLREVGLRSAIIVPLRAGPEPRGAVAADRRVGAALRSGRPGDGGADRRPLRARGRQRAALRRRPGE